MPPPVDRGSVWIVDLGMAAKVRPCLILSVPTDPQDRVLVTVVPHTTSVQGTRFEVAIPASFLKAGVFDAQKAPKPHGSGTKGRAVTKRRQAAVDELMASMLSMSTRDTISIRSNGSAGPLENVKMLIVVRPMTAISG